jgi:SAM-dependent methyltransferase
MSASVQIINPETKKRFTFVNSDTLKEAEGEELYQKEKGAFRFVKSTNYTDNFGFQWNKFTKTQIDGTYSDQSRERFFTATGWDKENLEGKAVLEVGSGAGRFTNILLNFTKAEVYSVDYSNAVEANYKNNGDNQRLVLFQASIYELPFAPAQFDKVFCFGVLQHTPDFKASVKALTEMVKPGGELIVDFYPIRGWWTKIHAKYIFRPFTKKISNEKLLSVIEKNIDWMISAHLFVGKVGLGKLLGRFIPICDITNTFPKGLTAKERREWAILDTFDMFSPEYDDPQRLETVKKWFEEFGMKNVSAEYKEVSYGDSLPVVKGYK